MRHQIICRDCINGMKQLDNNSIDLVVTDPPYFLTDKSGKGFMGKDWDSSKNRYKFHKNWAKEALRVLKPGAFAFVMSIPRQDCLSRMIIGLEDAGFEVNFTSIYHVFSSGFPKAMNISKKVLKDLEQKLEEKGYKEVEWEGE